jgi:hypothetical protein
MLLDSAFARIDLERDRLARLLQARGTRVECLEGNTWITLDGDPRDVVLSRGESFVVDSDAPVVVQAICGSAAVALLARAPGGPRPARTHGWRGWIAWLAPFATAG